MVAVERSDTEQTLGESLLHAGVLAPSLLQELLGIQAREITDRSFWEDRGFFEPPIQQALETLLKSQIYSMFDWHEGRFTFSAEEIDVWGAEFQLSRTRVVLHRGLSPQFLAMEGMRLRDERGKDDLLDAFLKSQATPNPDKASLPGQAAGGTQAASEVGGEEALEAVVPCKHRRDAAETELGREALLIVDDDPELAQMMARRMQRVFSEVVVRHGVTQALETLHEDSLGNWVVACDLIVPRSDNRGILGGLELLEMLRQRSTELPLLLFSDYQHIEAQSRAESLKIEAFLNKPRRHALYSNRETHTPSEPLVEFLELLASTLEPFARVPQAEEEASDIRGTVSNQENPEQSGEEDQGVEGRRNEEWAHSAQDSDPSFFDLGRALGADLEEPSSVLQDVSAPAWKSELTPLRSMLTELIEPANRDAVTLLILRFASQVLERAGLFLATRSQFVGLGGFAAGMPSETFVSRVRNTQLSVEEDSVFERVLRFRTAIRGPLEDLPGNRRLMEGMGAQCHPYHVVAIPLITAGQVAAILYGDNPSGKPLGDTDALEIFVQQAGLAMDRALLERRLDEARRRE